MPSSFAESLNLKQALDAVDASPKVEKAQSIAEEASWKRVESNSGFLPHVELGATRLTNKKFMLLDVALMGNAFSIPQIAPTTMYTLGANWILFDGLTSINRFRAASAGERSGALDFDWTKFQARHDTILAFYRAVAAQALADVATQNVKTLEDHLSEVRVLKKAGAGTTYDVLRVEVQLNVARDEQLSAKDNVAVGLLKLNELLGRANAPDGIEGALPVLGAELLKDQNLESTDRGDLRALQEKVEALSRLSEGAHGHWSPKISLFGHYQVYNNRDNSFTSSDAFRSAYDLGVQLSWNIFEGMGAYARDRQATEQRYQSEKTLFMSQLKAKNEVELWRRKYFYFCSVYQARLADIGKSNESVRLAREGRKAGSRTNNDVLDAETELFRAKAGAVEAQLGTVEALVNVELATGRTFHSFE